MSKSAENFVQNRVEKTKSKHLSSSPYYRGFFGTKN
jgi:hypothetical protein